MSIASRIEAIEQHLTDDYSVLTLAGADLTNVDKNILNLKLTWKERLLYFMNNGTQEVWDNWEKVVGEGTTITLNNTEEAPMKIVLKGNTSQETTTGKNLYNDNFDDYTQPVNYRICPIDLEIGQTYTLKATLKGTSMSGVVVAIVPYGNQYVDFSTVLKMAVDSQGYVHTITFTPDSTWTSPKLAIYASDKTTFDNLFTNYEIQLEKGSATSYEPYTNGASPNPDYPQDIHVVSGDNSIEVSNGDNTQSASYPINLPEGMELCKIGNYEDKFIRTSGKNLFDGEIKNIAFGSQGSTNVVLESSTYRGCYISCEAGKTYSVSRINNSNGRFRVMFSSSIPVAQTEIFGGTGNVDTYDSALKIENITAPENAKYLVIYLSNSSQDIPPIMINEGTTALPYEPYGTSWYLKKEIGKVVLDGSENWADYATQYTNYYTSYCTTKHFGYTGNMLNPDLFLINNFQSQRANFAVEKQFVASSLYATYIKISSSIVSTANDLKTWLSTHNTIVYYVLATPTYEPITDTTLINQLETIKKSYEGQTNISQENNDMSFILDITALSKE